MIPFKDFIKENDDSLNVKVGDKVKLTHKFGRHEKDRGEHTVTSVKDKHFTIDRNDEKGKPMKFKHNGYGHDFKSHKSGRIKNMSISSGHRVSLMGAK
jgi:uncharacterized protein Veg